MSAFVLDSTFDITASPNKAMVTLKYEVQVNLKLQKGDFISICEYELKIKWTNSQYTDYITGEYQNQRSVLCSIEDRQRDWWVGLCGALKFTW